jgi:hypothetical protein
MPMPPMHTALRMMLMEEIPLFKEIPFEAKKELLKNYFFTSREASKLS